MNYDNFWGNPQSGFLFFLINPFFTRAPSQLLPHFFKPPRYLHFNFADLADDLSITPEKRKEIQLQKFYTYTIN